MNRPTDPDTNPDQRRQATLRAAIAVAVPFLFVCQMVIFTGRIPARARYDQLLYHEPVIRGFLDQWPAFDFYDYLSATTPGYHLLLACIGKLFGANTAFLQVAGAVIGAGFVGTVAAAAACRTTLLRAVCFTLPLACSLYVFTSGAWLLPDNLGWLGVTLVLLVALRDRPTVGWLALGSIALLGLVFTRQAHLWAAAPLWAAAFLRTTTSDAQGESLGRVLSQDLPTKMGRTLVAIALTLPAFVLVWMFVRLWGGLTPPRFHLQHSSINVASVPFFLSIFGGLSVFFLPTLLPRLVSVVRDRPRVVLIVVACLLAAIIPPTNFDYLAGRRTGLWNIVQKLPVVAGHTSPLVVVLTVWGGLCLAAWLSAFDLRRRLVLLVALAGFWAAQAANAELWQRYVEPFVLVLLALFAAQASGNPTERRPGLMRNAEYAFPILLAVAFVGLNARSIWKAPLLSDGPPAVRSGDDRSDVPAPPDLQVKPQARRGLWW